MTYRDVAFGIGVAGDAALQLLSQTPFGEDWGLTQYFKIHGPVGAMFIAGSMMYMFTWFISAVSGPTPDYFIVFMYGVLLDVLFRVTRIMPTLDGYYTALSPLTTMIWGGIPAVLPFMVLDYLKV